MNEFRILASSAAASFFSFAFNHVLFLTPLWAERVTP